MTLEEFIDQVDDIYRRFTTSTITNMQAFDQELEALVSRAEALPKRHQNIANLAMKLREKQMEKDIAKASEVSDFEFAEAKQ